MAELLQGAPELALEWHRAGRGAALATVVQTWGSAPRRVGAQMVVSGDGQLEGSVSGGCVEGAVMLEAMDSLETGKGILLEFGVSDGDAFAVGLACGGTIKVLVEPVGSVLSEEVLAELVSARAERKAVAYVCDAETGGGRLTSDGFEERFRMDRSGVEEDGRFVAIHNPPLRLAIVGAVHIAQALVPMARIAGFDPVLVDPRSAFGSEARFPGETIIDEWPDEAMQRIGLDARTALVLLTHDPKLDDPALHIALKSPAFYVGALGSSRTHAKRVERLKGAGFSAEEIDRIHGPIGLDIGAASPSEIAVSIMGEMLRVLRKGA
ncbi:xanthine dehydrogenase accessory factor [Shimia isoporae]|uniref:Xanthine dehydrogenase accessory factor n=1 Tax=Shimia isoporae TaxID=647720 RepID=A0A4R1NMZ1_9RHOB|nr:XdhC family protein [Shimia isoporae]TCL09797.1 xanthine dehydrogenase accessory factor [Shimia isoporae]